MKRLIIYMLMVSALIISANVLAAADVANGQLKSASCTACHGVGGDSTNPMFPKIAGQHADYIVYVLQAYKTGKRINPMMQATAAALSDDDIIDLAAYFSAQEGLKTLGQ